MCTHDQAEEARCEIAGFQWVCVQKKENLSFFIAKTVYSMNILWYFFAIAEKNRVPGQPGERWSKTASRF